MSRHFPSLALAAGLSLGLTAAATAQSPVLASDGFDSGEFTLGDLNNQSNWSVIQGSAQVVADGAAEEGDQSVSLAANTIVDRALNAPGQSVVWTRTHFRGAGTTSAPNYPADPPASAIVHFSAVDGIQLGDGTGAGGVNFVAAPGYGTIDANSWYEILIRQDYTAKTWDCFIGQNGAPATIVQSDLGFRDDSVSALSGFRQYAGVASSLDTFLAQRPSPSDVDADGDIDAADVVLTVNAQTNAPTDEIVRSNTDVAEPFGTIDSADVDATVTAILGG